MLLNKKAKEKKGMCFIMEEKKEEKRVTEENKATKKEAVEKKVEKKATTAKKDNKKVATAKGKTESKKTSTTKKAEENKTEKMETKIENPNTFKKVDMKNKVGKNTTKEKKASHKVIKAILIIILILIGAYCIFFCRNLIILNNLKDLASQYEDIASYSYKTKNGNGYVSYAQKDNILRLDLENTNDPAKSMIIWQDKNTDEQIIAFPGHNTAIKSNIRMQVAASLPFTFTNVDDTINGTALFAFIYTETINNKECYVIQMAPDFKMWIEKDTGLLYKQDSGNDFISEVTELKIDNVDEIYKPDLTNYEVSTDVE